VDEEIVAIAIKKIGGAELPKFLGKCADDAAPGLEGWDCRRQPKSLQACEQKTKGILGIGLANRPKSSEWKVGRIHDAGNMTVMGENVQAATEFAHVALRVLQRQLARSRPSDMGDGQLAFDRMIFEKAYLRTGTGAVGVLDDAGIAILDKGYAPSVLVRSCQASMLGKRLERKGDRRRHAARQREELAHQSATILRDVGLGQDLEKSDDVAVAGGIGQAMGL